LFSSILRCIYSGIIKKESKIIENVNCYLSKQHLFSKIAKYLSKMRINESFGDTTSKELREGKNGLLH
jgi:hypothetical protein